MRAAEMSSGVDHRRDDQPKDQPDANMSHLTARHSVDHDGSTSSEDESECTDPFGDTGRKAQG